MRLAGLGLMYYDWTYILIMLPCFILSLICSASVKSNFSKYSKVNNSRGMTGAQAAQQVLNDHGVTGVRIEPVSGNLTDHFDPRTNVIRLSESVYNARTVSAVGVACHEAGHAVQHAEGYVPNKIRSAIVPVANIGSKLSWIVLVIGMLLPVQFNFVITIGIVLFSASVVFTLITLPVEFNASSRALKTIKSTGMLNESEYAGAKKVLSAAAMTYVAAAATSIMQLLRLILIFGNRRR
ncbi:MAG: zinc metallopeptidase [Ruminococcus sp.]|uniref:zinc metallopeptidase n=1 Tax=Ruminococcus sp. TaxID=41978 RepID=UPI002872B6E7|nr:zinc metallopeptidase [Ruminococcus sp.]MBQ3285953.1 zinc metallopeptidase [Ruminococcus sp.]